MEARSAWGVPVRAIRDYHTQAEEENKRLMCDLSRLVNISDT